MSIEEGHKAVSKAMFGIAPGESISKGICDRCKKYLRFNPVDGNCQPDCRFKFHPTYQSDGARRIVYNGIWVKFEWEANLCDRCLSDLSDWLLGKNWRYIEIGQEPPKEEDQ